MQTNTLTLQTDALTMQTNTLTLQADALTMQADTLTLQTDVFDVRPNLTAILLRISGNAELIFNPMSNNNDFLS
jgi:hypothetical protein